MDEIPRAFQRRPDVLQRDLGVETILYTQQMEAVHVLNQSARRIWDLCDGRHTVAEIERHLRAQFAVAEHYDLAADVEHALDVLLEKGLVVAVDRAA